MHFSFLMKDNQSDGKIIPNCKWAFEAYKPMGRTSILCNSELMLQCGVLLWRLLSLVFGVMCAFAIWFWMAKLKGYILERKENMQYICLWSSKALFNEKRHYLCDSEVAVSLMLGIISLIRYDISYRIRDMIQDIRQDTSTCPFFASILSPNNTIKS